MRRSVPFTIDANVFIATAVRQEIHHAQSVAFLRQISSIPMPVVCPTLLVVEVAAGIVRPTGDVALAQQSLESIETFPGMHLVELDGGLSQLAARLASVYRLRGADAVYLAVAQQYGATLITWDTEMLQRCPAVLPTLTPADWLASL